MKVGHLEVSRVWEDRDARSLQGGDLVQNILLQPPQHDMAGQDPVQLLIVFGAPVRQPEMSHLIMPAIGHLSCNAIQSTDSQHGTLAVVGGMSIRLCSVS